MFSWPDRYDLVHLGSGSRAECIVFLVLGEAPLREILVGPGIRDINGMFIWDVARHSIGWDYLEPGISTRWHRISDCPNRKEA